MIGIACACMISDFELDTAQDVAALVRYRMAELQKQFYPATVSTQITRHPVLSAIVIRCQVVEGEDL